MRKNNKLFALVIDQNRKKTFYEGNHFMTKSNNIIISATVASTIKIACNKIATFNN